jgi:sucrose synthase
VIDALNQTAHDHRDATFSFLRQIVRAERPILLRSDVRDLFEDATDGAPALERTALGEAMHVVQEVAVASPWLSFALRPSPGRWRFVRCHVESLRFEEVGSSEHLAFKERLVGEGDASSAWPLEVDLEPFLSGFPRVREAASIGRGGTFLNRRLAAQLFADSERGLRSLFRFLSLHSCRDQHLMISSAIGDVDALRDAARRAVAELSRVPAEATWDTVGDTMRGLGFEPGWGRTAERMGSTLELLLDMLEAPEPATFEALLARIPMVFRIAILSPHGYFGQDRVLGLPDTGGQVVYILDQVRALEREMRRRLHEQGVDFEPEIAVVTRLIPETRGTNSDQAVEPIAGCANARILRVPFRSESGEIVPHWISRFAVWPYLERFALEAEPLLMAELGDRPDLIIGNYSDGNLVATLLSQRMGVTQCAIAHALEKSKYVLSDLYWQDQEDQYGFSRQFVADLIAMNAADFIITSTKQEIAGNGETAGQYESYSAFTMPGLLRVSHGIEVFDPRFNIVSPGVDDEVYFPFDREEQRFQGLHPEIESWVLGGDHDEVRGRLADPDKPLILSLARMDRIKNLTGLTRWFGESEELRQRANLVIVGGVVDEAASGDDEERAEIRTMHQIMDAHGLDGSVRWIGTMLERPMVGELYRWVADRRGVFVQPARFEAFGLTVIEAMTSGLPTFATVYGGPLEIIQDGESGFHIDPNHGDDVAATLCSFLQRSQEDSTVWMRVSEAARRRVAEHYTWPLHAERLMTLARVYGFWRYVSQVERSEIERYLQALYNLMLRPRMLAQED